MSGWLNDKNTHINGDKKMQYTLEQCLEQQKKVDAGIKHNREYNPLRAAIAEVVEFQEHLGLIKTWTDNKINKKQAFMESVDVKAFVMSYLIEQFFGDVALIIEEYNKYISCNDVYYTNAGHVTDAIIGMLINKGQINSFTVLSCLDSLCVNEFKKPHTDLNYYYMGKQTLTRFRQKNGYPEGTYVKKWGGREDNEFLTDALEQGIEIEAVYEHLKTNYERIVIAKAEVE